jgi:hypothetical protein
MNSPPSFYVLEFRFRPVVEKGLRHCRVPPVFAAGVVKGSVAGVVGRLDVGPLVDEKVRELKVLDVCRVMARAASGICLSIYFGAAIEK